MLLRDACKPKCQEKFGYQDGAGDCTACKDTNCQICGMNNFVCNTCVAGFYNKGEVCTKCELSNCKTCAMNNTTLVCSECLPGFVRENGNTTGACVAPKVCEAGTGLTVDNVCTKCSDINCGICGKDY